MPPTDLIFDDGELMESNRHRIAMNILIRSINQAFANRDDFFAGGNMFIYYSSTQARNRDFKDPYPNGTSGSQNKTIKSMGVEFSGLTQIDL